MRKAVALAVVLFGVRVTAQTPYLVKDINNTTAFSTTSSSPSNFVGFRSRVYFSAFGETGTELYVTDGTADGTSIVADINPNERSSDPSQFAIVNDRLIFNAFDEVHGVELWVSDGTAAGTHLLADIDPILGSSSPGERIVFHDKMLFSARDPVNGRELWITDGTASGTKLVKDLLPGTADSRIGSFIVFHDTVYFIGNGRLWKTDGTESGTVSVSTGDAQPLSLTAAGSFIFFQGTTKEAGSEPWVTDGTDSGAHLLLDINPGSPSSAGFIPVAFGDRVLFAATDPQHGWEPWITDGTASGTHLIRDIDPGPPDSLVGLSATIIDNTAFFAAYSPGVGQELWRTDGTESGTVMVARVGSDSGGSLPDELVAANGKIYFTALVNGARAVWVTDGTAAGTHPLKTTAPFPIMPPAPTIGLFRAGLTSIGGFIYFAAANLLNGFEPWRSDGTDAGTVMIKNIAQDSVPSSNPSFFTVAADWVYFQAWDGAAPPVFHGSGPVSLWRSDGTAAGTLRIADQPDSQPWIAVGRSLFFQHSVLWKTDGTPEGTGPATAFESRFPGQPTIVFVLGNTILVNVARATGDELWAASATSDAPAISLGSRAAFRPTEVAGKAMYFVSGPNGAELWVTDATPSGTRRTAQITAGQLGAICASGGTLYFVGTSAVGLKQLWKSDGTPEGTVAVKTLSNFETKLIPAGKNLFIIEGRQLSASDGTEAGTRALPLTFDGTTAAAIGEQLVFAATDTTNGSELWISDGTIGGTRLLRDIYAGTRGSGPRDFLAADGLAYFAAADNVSGLEPWVTDGTAEGTRLIADLDPGLFSSNPSQFNRAGRRVFFSAFTRALGTELWALDLPATPRLSIDDLRIVEGNSGTTIARFTVTLSDQKGPVTVDYATSDGTAVAGADYDSVSGTLTFGAGETSKTIDVAVRGDVIPENNETLFVTLRNASGATIEKPTGTAIIDDDDQLVDIALAADFSHLDTYEVAVRATNNGPRAVTDLRLRSTVTPDFAEAPIFLCPPPAQISAGTTVCIADFRSSSDQTYHTVTATPAQGDSAPANNTIAWTQRLNLAMDALSVAPGNQATGWVSGSLGTTTVSLSSSDPTIVSVPSTVDLSTGRMASFPIRGLHAGSATIRAFSPTSQNLGDLVVNVLNPGDQQRWPGGINVTGGATTLLFDQPLSFRISAVATAPYNGETATGVVRIVDGGKEISQITISPTTPSGTLQAYLLDVGKHAITVEYGGDANFLPSTKSLNVATQQDSATISASAVRNGSSAMVSVRVSGSSVSAPTGTITVQEPGIVSSTQPLVSFSGGESRADFTINNVASGPHTYVILYSGDAHYYPTTRNAPLSDGRRRAVKH
jgi:ELWxxDGT repeat protein